MILLENAPTYYSANCHYSLQFTELKENLDCDVCVIGAGITGCSTALHLAQRGYKVIVLEAGKIANGGSGRSGGQILAGYSADLETLENLVGKENTKQLWQFSIEAVNLCRELIEKYTIRCDLQQGAVALARKTAQAHYLQQQYETFTQHYQGWKVALWDKTQVQTWIHSPLYIQALYHSEAFHLNPLNYTLGLAHAAQQLGAQFFEDSTALQLSQTAQNTLISTQKGQIRCRFAVLANDFHAAKLLPAIRGKVLPLYSYQLATESLTTAQANVLMESPHCAYDLNFSLNYFRLGADNSLIFGGAESYRATLPARTAGNALQRRLTEVFPQLGKIDAVKIKYLWGGMIPISLNRAPHFGREENLYYAQGFSGHGLALATLAGKIMAESIDGTASRFDVFTQIPHRRFVGGYWQQALLAIALNYYRLRDWL